jgi:transcriptional regulator with XRE-family HTH domain
MSPFSQFLYELRKRRDIRQAELANLLGYEQSYISALEVGLKGPPTDEFVERLIQALTISQVEQQELRAAVQASQRKLVIDPDAPPDIYWLLDDLRGKLEYLKPGQVRMIKEILDWRETFSEERPEQSRRLKRRARKEEATM